MAVTQLQSDRETTWLPWKRVCFPLGGGVVSEPREPETVCGCVNSAQSDPGLVTQVGGGAGGGVNPFTAASRSSLLTIWFLKEPGFGHQS